MNKTRASLLLENLTALICLHDWLKPKMTADGLLVCIKDNNLSNKYLKSAVFMMFPVDYKSCSKLIDKSNLIFGD